jgi:hypothetical protein
MILDDPLLQELEERGIRAVDHWAFMRVVQSAGRRCESCGGRGATLQVVSPVVFVPGVIRDGVVMERVHWVHERIACKAFLVTRTSDAEPGQKPSAEDLRGAPRAVGFHVEGDWTTLRTADGHVVRILDLGEPNWLTR